MLNPLFSFQCSRIYSLIMGIVGVIIFVLILSLSFSFLPKIFILISTFLYLIYLLRRYVLLRHPQAVVSLQLLNERTWLIKTQQKEYQAQLLGESVLSSGFSALRFEIEQKRKLLCLIFPDSLPPHHYRHLRAQILHARK